MSAFRHIRATRAAPGVSLLLLGAALALLPMSKSVARGMKEMPGMDSSKKMAPATAGATGTVTAINATDHKVTLDHGAIPAIKWPPMKMEFAVAPSVDLSKVKMGDKVDFTLSGSGGSYTVQSIAPAK